MLAAMVIVVACLFFLGLGLLISTNPLVVLGLAVIGLILGGLAGLFLLRGRVAQAYHWSIFVGPAASALVFALLCGVLNLLVSDNLGMTLGGARMYSVALLLGTAPGLVIGLLLGTTFSGRGSHTSTYQPARTAAASSGPTLRPPGPPLPPGPPAGAPSGQPFVAGAPSPLGERLAVELPGLARFGAVQLRDLQDGTMCAVVTRHDGVTFYLVCTMAYPQQPPTVKVERAGVPIDVGPGVLFPWDSSCRLERIIADLNGRI